MKRPLRLLGAVCCALIVIGARPRTPDVPRDPANPTCPQTPNWTDIQQMTLTPVTRNGVRILMAEGMIDAGLPERLRSALVADPLIDEIWLRSPGGNARAGTEAGRIIRARFAEAGVLITTRIPSGWTCFSACNFMFLGGSARVLEPNGVFMVHMFTFTNDRGAIRYSVDQGTEATTELIGDVEQESALLASEDNDFLVRMGIPRALLTEVMYRQRAVASGATPAQRYCLNSAEAERYRVHRPPSNDE
ncbi:MAG: hypothetical protein ABL874_12305 [Sphingopyxis sp.]